MEISKFTEMMVVQQKNIEGLQKWMRDSKVNSVDITYNPSTSQVKCHFTAEKNTDHLVESSLIRQHVHDNDTDVWEAQDVKPMAAIREIFRISISDDLIHHLTINEGAGIRLQNNGFMELTMDDYPVRIPPLLIN